MQVEVGPVSSGSVVAWCTYAREAIDGFGGRGRRLELPDGVAPRFDGLLADWEALAAEGDGFKWVTDMSVEEIEYLVNALRSAAAHVADGIERGWLPAMPEDAEAFNDALVTGLLDTLRAAGGASRQFAEWLFSEWPGAAGRRIR